MTLNENVNSAADEQKAKLADGVAGEGVALSDEDLEQVSGGSSAYLKPSVKRKRKDATVSNSALRVL